MLTEENSPIGAVVAELQRPDARVIDLLDAYSSSRWAELWADESLYLAFAKRLLQAGHAARAFELCREGLGKFLTSPWLRYYASLALARGGNSTLARQYLEPLLDADGLAVDCKSEALSLAGRLAKDRFGRMPQGDQRKEAVEESAMWYGKAYELSADVFPGINAATTTLLSGRVDQARHLARSVRSAAVATMADRNTDYWLAATLGEASLILNEPADAVDWYGRAAEAARGRWGDIASMRRNVLLLGERVEVPKEIHRLLGTGTVVASSGHMIDHPTRALKGLPPRFPNIAALEERVARAIRATLDSLQPTVGYCSAACGSDILFAEAMLDRGAELHLVIPFDRDDFYSTSVDFGLAEMASWRHRCDAVIERATEVHYATREHFLGDDALFDFTNSLTQGLALSRARELAADAHIVIVLDRGAPSHVADRSGARRSSWTDGPDRVEGHRSSISPSSGSARMG